MRLRDLVVLSECFLGKVEQNKLTFLFSRVFSEICRLGTVSLKEKNNHNDILIIEYVLRFVFANIKIEINSRRERKNV